MVRWPLAWKYKFAHPCCYILLKVNAAVILGHLERLVRVTDQIIYIATTMTTISKLGLK